MLLPLKRRQQARRNVEERHNGREVSTTERAGHVTPDTEIVCRPSSPAFRMSSSGIVARLAPPRVRVACADDVDWTVYDRRTRQMRTQRAKVQDIQGIRPRNRDELREKGVLLESGPCNVVLLRVLTLLSEPLSARARGERARGTRARSTRASRVRPTNLTAIGVRVNPHPLGHVASAYKNSDRTVRIHHLCAA